MQYNEYDMDALLHAGRQHLLKPQNFVGRQLPRRRNLPKVCLHIDTRAFFNQGFIFLRYLYYLSDGNLVGNEKFGRML